ncbi:dynein light chain Tctex-type protein 2B-like isoform X1 [Clavelina lepadiformis]|uniref:dynein light chain Tctex-type protein 2B-like isoform X1 n=1 Tax=Clavelina lepadiformis TaxID=159417 RepID=UPI0040413F61
MNSPRPFDGRRHSIDPVAIANMAHQSRRTSGIVNPLAGWPQSRRHSVMVPPPQVNRRRSSRLYQLQTDCSTTFTGLPLAPIPQRIENTYKIGPDEGKQYKQAEVRKAAERIVDEVLEGVPYMEKDFPTEKVILRKHRDIWGKKVMQPSNGGKVAKILVEEVKDELKKLNMDRYKFVVNAVVGDGRGQGMLMASRCLWDTETDGHVTVQRTTEKHFAVVTVHAVYYE